MRSFRSLSLFSFALVSLSALSIGVGGCYPPDDTKEKDDTAKSVDDTEDTIPETDGYLLINTPAGSASADIPFTVTAIHPDSPKIELAFTWSADSAEFSPATVTGAPISLAAAPTPGATVDITWSSLTDLGLVDTTAFFRVDVVGGEGVWTGAQTDSFNVTNADANDPPEVDVQDPEGTLPSGAVDGMVIVPFSVSDPDNDEVSVTVEFKSGSTWSVATKGGESDRTSGLSAGSYNFVWDSAADLGSVDASSVQIRMTPNDGWVDGETDQTGSFDVENDPTPDMGELILSEIMIIPAYSTVYIEIQNLTGHALNLAQLYIADATTTNALTSAGTVDPHDFAILTDDGPTMIELGLTYNQEISGINFGRMSDSVVLSGPLGEMSRVDYNSTDWPYLPGISMQLSADKATAGLESSAENWCGSTSEMADGADLGTPGWENSVCAEVTKGYTSWTGDMVFFGGWNESALDLKSMNCMVSWSMEGTPITDICDGCDFGFDVALTLEDYIDDGAYDKCAGYKGDMELALAYEPDYFGDYAALMFYIESRSAWYAFAVVTDFDGTNMGILRYFYYNEPTREGGSTYYYTYMWYGAAVVE